MKYYGFVIIMDLIMSPQNPYVQTLTPNVTVFGG